MAVVLGRLAIVVAPLSVQAARVRMGHAGHHGEHRPAKLRALDHRPASLDHPAALPLQLCGGLSFRLMVAAMGQIKWTDGQGLHQDPDRAPHRRSARLGIREVRPLKFHLHP